MSKVECSFRIEVDYVENIGIYRDVEKKILLEPYLQVGFPSYNFWKTQPKAKLQEDKSWKFEAAIFKFYQNKVKFNTDEDILHINIKDSVKSDKELLGVAFLNLSELPGTEEGQTAQIQTEMTLDLAKAEFKGSRVKIKVQEVIGFGCDSRLSKKNAEVYDKIVKTRIHYAKNPMKNAVVCLEDYTIFRSIEGGIKHIHKISAESEKQHDLDKLPRTLVIFEGRYLVDKTLKIDKEGIILYGIPYEGEVFIGSRNLSDLKGDYLFEIGKDVKKFFIHNIKFNPKERTLKSLNHETKIQANLCILGQAAIEPKKKDLFKDNIKESSIPFALQLDIDDKK